MLISDEYQDMSPLQHQMFLGLWKAQAGREFWVVGDPQQSIYGFQGGRPELMQQLEAQADHRFHLSRNFRSPRRHLALAASALPPGETREYWSTARPDDGKDDAGASLDRSKMLRRVAATFWKTYQDGQQPSTVVLVRTQEQRDALRRQLSLYGEQQDRERIYTAARLYLDVKFGEKGSGTENPSGYVRRFRSCKQFNPGVGVPQTGMPSLRVVPVFKL
ncbi:UvrD-helicase domain-containing protein, partial [Deinococcus radiophilus]|uniref:UvrD-helicase domain-containing protein n=1 Tax=Deinococcus radiophilus TaxID=32062 RepID=UPI00147289CA